MKILAFVDIHGSENAFRTFKNNVKKYNPDLIICAGDFTLFEQNMKKILKKINSLNRPVFLVHGNHESVKDVRSLCKEFKNIRFIHKKIVPFQNVLFVGFGGGGFSYKDKKFEQWIKKNKAKLKNKKIVLITHAPPFNTKVDYLAYSKVHAGNKSFSDFIKKNKKVILSISGHLHETAGKNDKLNNAKVSNPGPFGKVFTI